MTGVSNNKGKKFITYTIAAFFIIGLLNLFISSAVNDIDEDEVEHYHITWLLTEKVYPYKDIHQIHTPLLWLVFRPIIRILPRRSYSLLVVRGITLIFFLLFMMVGRRIMYRIFPDAPEEVGWLYYAIFLSQGIPLQGYYFRPDVFMSFFAALGILFSLDSNKSWKHFFLSGIFTGIAISFSPKIVPVFLFVLLLPLIGGEFSPGKRAGNSLMILLGALVGLSPSFAWLVKNDLLRDFYFWVFENNASMLRGIFVIKKDFLALAFPVLLSLFSIFYFSYFKRIVKIANNWKLYAFLLSALSIQVLDPNHLPYNLQVAMIPVSFLIGYFLYKEFLARLSMKSTIGVLLIALVFLNYPFINRMFRFPSERVGFVEMDALMKLPRQGDTCVAFAPMHPVFCKDATQLYLVWDILFPVSPMLTRNGRMVYLRLWKDAVKDIISKKPRIVVGPHLFSTAHSLGLISKKALYDLFGVFNRHYMAFRIDKKIVVLVRKSPPG